MNLDWLRKEYKLADLSITSTHPDPFIQLQKWVQEAIDAKITEPNAMVLATISKEGYPNSRVVLLKNIAEDGLDFYTNLASEKGQELAADPHVALLLVWLDLERQVRIRGVAERLPEATAAAYFNSRPRESQIGTWASPQSQVIKDRETIEKAFQELEKKFEGQKTIPLPPNWGGFRVKPTYFEFWQGRQTRLHDRIRYTKPYGNEWVRDILAS